MSDPRPILHAKMPLKNVKHARELTAEQSEWWHSFGAHLDAARKSFDTIPSGLPEIDWWRAGVPTPWWLVRR